MTLKQHPLSAAFPAMSAEELCARLDGAIPSSDNFLKKVIASDWFQGLKKSQRAMYAVRWFHFCERGSNQHKRIQSKSSTRFAAEQAQTLIAGVSA